MGLHIIRDRVNRKLCLSQPSFIASIVSTFDMMYCNPDTTFANSNSRFVASSSPFTEVFSYFKAVGSLLYLMMSTRLDITFVVGPVALFVIQTDVRTEVVRLLESVFGNVNDGLLKAFSVADYAGNFNTHRSTTGYTFLPCGGPVA